MATRYDGTTAIDAFTLISSVQPASRHEKITDVIHNRNYSVDDLWQYRCAFIMTYSFLRCMASRKRSQLRLWPTLYVVHIFLT
jgi:hypothetical protein